MRVCDRCIEPNKSTQQINIILEDEWFDLCDKHMQELREFPTTKEKPKRFRKNSAKAA
jgi:hypothetical protein